MHYMREGVLGSLKSESSEFWTSQRKVNNPAAWVTQDERGKYRRRWDALRWLWCGRRCWLRLALDTCTIAVAPQCVSPRVISTLVTGLEWSVCVHVSVNITTKPTVSKCVCVRWFVTLSRAKHISHRRCFFCPNSRRCWSISNSSPMSACASSAR